ncbi:F0F1 ATP synthase subunit delta [Sphingomonas oryzagri]|uniref:ATP synthase subunit delta n=1 Tax=Sphingomonas oryzagri TaxID=3042314 RepID=A0ABT6MVX2_9SPHN|nr:F0F1 ATP synthase subunit delta [Sphingomonas oryzagri]MDH7637148.1 F0F1 ATP synthase subunit delta [Sphingomonas oryzagri]
MDISGGIQASLSGRYALALFELARDERQIEQVSADLDTIKAAMAESADFRALISSPLVGRDAATKAILAVAESMKLGKTVSNTLGLLGHNGRLNQLPAIIRGFKALAAAHRGETTAEVTSAHPLDAEQTGALKDKLRQKFGRDVAIEAKVDPSILGGLIVKMGSQQIDGSIRTKLNTLAHAMKG